MFNKPQGMLFFLGYSGECVRIARCEVQCTAVRTRDLLIPGAKAARAIRYFEFKIFSMCVCVYRNIFKLIIYHTKLYKI